MDSWWSMCGNSALVRRPVWRVCVGFEAVDAVVGGEELVDVLVRNVGRITAKSSSSALENQSWGVLGHRYGCYVAHDYGWKQFLRLYVGGQEMNHHIKTGSFLNKEQEPSLTCLA